MDGVIVLDKPRGPTSHDVVQLVRKAMSTREVGHAGTLDPMATGVLVVAIGEGTKLIPYLTAGDKTYEATVKLGVSTDTLDAEGKETARIEVPADLAARLPAVLDAERARTKQVPPAFSAIHSGGERAHEKARRGEAVDLAPRDVSVRSLDGSIDADCIHLRLTASKGYYVRSLARDLADALSTAGHLIALRRTRSGCFDLSDASSLDAPRLISLVDAASRTLPSITLTATGAANAHHGRPVAAEDMSSASVGPSAWLHDGALIAIGEVRDGTGHVLRGIRGT
jgi:tRNA pseudouridine55 synthase